MMPDMNDRLSKLVLAGAVAVAGLGFAGCSAEVSVGDKTIDSADLEGQLADQLSSQAGFKASQVSVDCPSDQKVEKGTEFTCNLKTPDGAVTVNVTLTDDDGNYDATAAKSG
jgi:hypothetical protein